MAYRLAEALVAASRAPCDDHEALERALLWALERAHETYPTVRTSSSAFASFVGARLAPGIPALRALEALRLDDLYLTCACADNDPVARVVTERACVRQVDAAVGRLRAPRSFAEEVQQVLRERLFVATPDHAPRIAEYGGRSALARWLYAIATRAAIDMLRREGKYVSADAALLDRALPPTDPELELIKQRYSADFRDAVRDAVAELAAGARNDLSFYYVDGLTLDQLALMHGVTASAVSRRLAKSRQTILARTRAILSQRLRVSDDDVHSILRLIGSRLELSVGALRPSAGKMADDPAD